MKLEKFLESSLWALWWLVVGGAAFWVIVGSIGFFSRNGWLPNEASGWAQAVGAGIAIITAAYIPMWHAKVATIVKQKKLAWGYACLVRRGSRKALATFKLIFEVRERSQNDARLSLL